MRYAYHGGTAQHVNLLTDIRAARDLGYDSIELWTPKVLRYLDAGYTVDDLAAELGDLPVPMLDVIIGIERLDPESVDQRRRDCVRLSEVAARIGCPTIEVVATEYFEQDDWPSQRKVVVESLRALSDITSPLGIKLAIEPLVFSPFNRLAQAYEVIDWLGTERVGLCLDTWHLWTSGETWDDVAAVDPALILSVQLSDTSPRSGPQWRDEVRTALPGDGILPLDDAVAAIAATGYRGHWCTEMLSARHYEWHPEDLGRVLLERLRHYVPPLPSETPGERVR